MLMTTIDVQRGSTLEEVHAFAPTNGLCKEFFFQNPSLLWKWVGGSRSHLEFSFLLENHPKIALN